MSQRPAAQPPQPEHDQVTSGNAPVRGLELGTRGIDQHHQRRFGHPAQCGGHVQRIAHLFDQLHAKGKAQFANPPAHAAQQRLIVIALLAARKKVGKLANAPGKLECGGVDQRVEQVGAPRQRIGQRRGETEDAREQPDQRRFGFKQAEQAERAGQSGEQLLPAQDATHRLGPPGEGGHQLRADRIEGGACGLAAQCPNLAAAPACDALGQRGGVLEAQFGELGDERVTARRGDLHRRTFRGVLGQQSVVTCANRLADPTEFGNQCRTAV